MKFDVIFASSNSSTAKYLFTTVDILSVRWSMVTKLFESNLLRWLAPEPTHWDDMPNAGISLLLTNSMLCMSTFFLGPLINFLLHGWILQCHDGSQFLSTELFPVMQSVIDYTVNGRELTLDDKMLTYNLHIYINFRWISILSCLPHVEYM